VVFSTGFKDRHMVTLNTNDLIYFELTEMGIDIAGN